MDNRTIAFLLSKVGSGGSGGSGSDGVGIESITKTGTVGLVDTYTILYTDGETTTFTVTNGSDGQDGTNGIDGTNGTDGSDGDSAYEIAVENGFSGTEAEWLLSLKGSDGIDGQDGTNGTNGQDGLTTSITLNGEIKTQVGGNIDLGDLATVAYITELVGDINDALDGINGEVI